MAKKITRGITGIKDITKQDFDTNNVNDLLSDGQYNYIHRKKGKSEEYHNLTDNLKTLSSDNTDLLTITNNNKTNNTATLRPKHDTQKEQVLESERNTVTIQHGTNATTEKTKVDTNPEKVLEHDNLLTDYGISKNTTGNTTKLGLEYTKVESGFDLNNLENGRIRANYFTNAPRDNTYYFVSSFVEGEFTIQEAVRLIDDNNTTYRRFKNNGMWNPWREQVGDKSTVDDLLAKKQNTLTNSESIAIVDSGLRQLYTHKQTYSENGWLLKTYVKYVSPSTSVDTLEEEFNFILYPNIKNANLVTFTLNEHDKTKFNNIITTLGTSDDLYINGYLFVLEGDTLTVSSYGPGYDYVMSFSDII